MTYTRKQYSREIRRFENAHGKVIHTKRGLKRLGIKGEPKFDNQARYDLRE